MDSSPEKLPEELQNAAFSEVPPEVSATVPLEGSGSTVSTTVKTVSASSFKLPYKFFLRVLGIFMVSIGLISTIAFPVLIENSDYLSAFYVAGRAVLNGTPSVLYPQVGDTSFHTTAFNLLAHKVLPHLPPNLTAIYMYSPANAALYAPFALLSPAVSMFVWQLLSIASTIGGIALLLRTQPLAAALQRASSAIREPESTGSAVLLGDAVPPDDAVSLSDGSPAAITGGVVASKDALVSVRLDDVLWCFFLFFPVFHTVLIGQLGLLLGVLPLAGAAYLLLRGKEFAAGLCLSAFLLKPQFMPVGLLLAGALALNKRWQCTLGLVIGCVAVVFVTVGVMGPATWPQFFNSFGMTDAFFVDPSYGVPFHLIACLPGTVMQYVGPDQRALAKLITYGIAALCGLHALVVCTKLYRTESRERAILLTLMIGVMVLPIVVPHLLFYDLCIFAVAGFYAFSLPWPRDDKFIFCVWGGATWMVCNVGYILAVAVKPLAQPALLVLVLAIIYARMVKLAVRG